MFQRHSNRSQISGLALPALMSLLVDPILSLVDTAYVGRGLGAISLAALGKCVAQQIPRAFLSQLSRGRGLRSFEGKMAADSLRRSCLLGVELNSAVPRLRLRDDGIMRAANPLLPPFVAAVD